MSPLIDPDERVRRLRWLLGDVLRFAAEIAAELVEARLWPDHPAQRPRTADRERVTDALLGLGVEVGLLARGLEAQLQDVDPARRLDVALRGRATLTAESGRLRRRIAASVGEARAARHRAAARRERKRGETARSLRRARLLHGQAERFGKDARP